MVECGGDVPHPRFKFKLRPLVVEDPEDEIVAIEIFEIAFEDQTKSFKIVRAVHVF